MLMIQDALTLKEIISGFCENMYFELFSFSIKRATRRGSDIFTHKSHNEKGANFFVSFVLCSLSEKKKQVSLEVTHSP